MFKVLNCVNRNGFKRVGNCMKLNKRTFLSQAYYCQEAWDHSLQDVRLQKIHLDEFYHELEQRFQKTRQMSAVDVDIFATAISDNSYKDEMLDIVHKLRLSADSMNTLGSTPHIVIRTLAEYGNKDELLQVLDDRLNYGVFLDFYTANLLLDKFWKGKDFTAGSRTASQLMLQEEFDHPISRNLSILHLYNYLLKPEGWPQDPQPEEPEEEIKIRVKYLRNPYADDHFDLKEPNKIVGKSLAMFTQGRDDPLNRSFNVVGLALYNKPERVKEAVKECNDKNIVLYKDIIDLLPEENELKKELQDIKTESINVQDVLKTNVEKAVQETSENDIASQCKIYAQWEIDRKTALQEQQKRLETAKRIANIDELKKLLKEKETKLWFFNNEEQIELDIEAKRIYYPKKWFGKKKKPRKIDEGYVPPEVKAKGIVK